MATCRCHCGAKYRVPDSAIGKRSKCKKCGTVFTIEAEDEGPIPIADDIGLADEVGAAIERGHAPVAQSDQGRLVVPPGSPAALVTAGPASAVAAGPAEVKRGYLSNVLWSFLFLATPSNLITFIVMWVALSLAFLLGFSWIFALLALIVIQGWYSAFRFAVLQSAAAGEDEIPTMSTVAESIAELVEALLAWIGSWIVVLLPAFAYMMYAVNSGMMTGWEAFQMIIGGVPGMLQGTGGELLVLDILVYLGLALWPMVILCVALGGFATLYRPDLLILTIVKTFPMYLLTVALMLGAILLITTLSEMGTAGVAGRTGTTISGILGSAMIIHILVTRLVIYLDIVLMRLVGLIYHHFNGRFAWDWG